MWKHNFYHYHGNLGSSVWNLAKEGQGSVLHIIGLANQVCAQNCFQEQIKPQKGSQYATLSLMFRWKSAHIPYNLYTIFYVI
jgi:hypothetical protein